MQSKSTSHLNVYLGDGLKASWDLYCQERGLKPGAALKASIQREIDRVKQGVVEPAVQRDERPDYAPKKRAEIRLTPSELDAVDARAIHEGCSRATWLVNVVRGTLTKQAQMGMREIDSLGESNYQLLAIGRNLNQIAKRLNEGHPDVITVKYIERLTEEFRTHVKKVSKVMGASIERWSLR
ncbi:MAG: plasmid mobilization relaxosome protein MobC [Rhodanobacter sp.]